MLFNKYFLSPVLLVFILSIYNIGLCISPDSPGDKEADWGIAVTVRTATIAFDTNDESVSSFVPLLFFDGDRLFLDGLEGGVKIYKQKKYRFDLLGRLRFFDIPREFQNEIQGDTVDVGVRMKYFFTDQLEAGVDVMTDEGGRFHSNLTFKYHLDYSAMELSPYLQMRLAGGDFNSYYYGMDRIDVGSEAELRLGFDFRYHVWKNLFAIGRIQSTWLGESVRDTTYVDRDNSQEIYLGIGFFNEDRTKRKPALSITPYLRLAHGWATPSNIGDIVTGNTESDDYNNQLTSIFYGHPLTDELFGFPLSIYLTPGFVYHWSSEVQSDIPEYIVAIKAYYTFTWPITWRFGAAEGLSYVSDIPFVEQSEMERKGYEPSNLMNYLDFSIDIDLGDLFRSESLKNWYLGYSIHHRSAIFESASQFGRISGGANFNTIYLQYHF